MPVLAMLLQFNAKEMEQVGGMRKVDYLLKINSIMREQASEQNFEISHSILSVTLHFTEIIII